MHPILFELTESMILRLKALGATHFSFARNYNNPNQHIISSVHFFSSDKLIPASTQNALKGLQEVAYFSPDMHSHALGKLSGFNECKRINGIDVHNVRSLFDGGLDLSQY